jgi:hypothetical protein
LLPRILKREDHRQMKKFFTPERIFFEIIAPILVFGAITLIVTFLFTLLSDPSARVGGIRPENTIAPKLLELAAGGALLGCLASLAERKADINLIILSVFFVMLVDLDHIPAALGIPEPIRPAHSISFIVITSFALFLVFRGKIHLPLIALSSFLGHIAADTGLFAPFAPISFEYLTFNRFDFYFIATAAVFFAIIAGSLKRRSAFNETLSERNTITLK